MRTSVQLTKYSGASVSKWTGTVGTDPTVGTEQTNLEVLDFGVVEQDDNSFAQAITVEFPSNFDDTVYSQVRAWVANQPALDGHAWMIEFAANALFPAVSLAAPLTNGVTLPTSPFDAIKRTAAGAASSGSDVYIPANKRIKNVLLQLQTASGAEIYNQLDSLLAPLVLYLEYARRPQHAHQMLGIEHVAFDSLSYEQLFTFSDVDVFWVETIDDVEYYWQVGAIKDETVSMTPTEEMIEWGKFKPKVPVHMARNGAGDEIKFKLDELSPKVWAAALQTAPTANSTDRTIDIVHQALLSDVFKGKWCIQWKTLGKFLVRAIVPQATISQAEFAPGADDFAGAEITLKALATPNQRTLMTVKASDTPVELVRVPFIYEVIEATS